MRISELAERTGVPLATIKYYLREGLLPPGRATAPNQADYDATHARRLQLIRVLRDVGGASIDAIRGVVEAIDDPGRSLHETLGAAHRAVSPAAPAQAPPPEAREVVDALLDRLGWRVAADAPARAEVAEAVAGLRRLGHDVGADDLLRYAWAIEPIAREEVAGVPRVGARDEAVEYLVVGTVVYETVLSALRRLAQEHHSAAVLRDAGGREPRSRGPDS